MFLLAFCAHFSATSGAFCQVRLFAAFIALRLHSHVVSFACQLASRLFTRPPFEGSKAGVRRGGWHDHKPNRFCLTLSILLYYYFVHGNERHEERSGQDIGFDSLEVARHSAGQGD